MLVSRTRVAMLAGMIDSDTGDARPSPLLGALMAALIGGAFLIGVGAVAVFTWRDHGREETLESFEQVTAVGDSRFFDVKLPGSGTISIQHAGKTWQPRDLAKINLRDTEVSVIGGEEASGLKIYQPIAEPKADEIFLKIGLNRYVLLKPGG